ncbi:hypothetical protein DPMN_126636 [Dreissena polymorpha]|uniref:Uncharacterized protein n=1 Tax=Dreissena polymorpha TaxID=45954 RepID=A0A9D4GXG4_DREPO|nr:hypothetical protein DPMN_126636 [Dreissena polymorpha]
MVEDDTMSTTENNEDPVYTTVKKEKPDPKHNKNDPMWTHVHDNNPLYSASNNGNKHSTSVSKAVQHLKHGNRSRFANGKAENAQLCQALNKQGTLGSTANKGNSPFSTQNLTEEASCSWVPPVQLTEGSYN